MKCFHFDRISTLSFLREFDESDANFMLEDLIAIVNKCAENEVDKDITRIKALFDILGSIN